MAIWGLELLRTLRGHSGPIHRIAWSPNGQWIASPSRDGVVRVWDFRSGETVAALLQNQWVSSVAWAPGGDVLVAGLETGRMDFWQVSDWSLQAGVREHAGRIECLAWSSDDVLASASSDGTVGIWRNRELIHRLDDHHSWVNAVAWSPDGHFLATGAEDPSVKVWDAKTFRLLHTFREHRDWVTDLAWHPDSHILASASDVTIRLWQPDSGTLLREIRGHEKHVKCLSFSSDGTLLASKGEDNTVRIWRHGSWEQVGVFEEPTLAEVAPEANLAFHPTAPILATLGEHDAVIRIWSADVDRLLGSAPVKQEVAYQNAKVVLVGSSSTGKTCLARALVGLRFEPQESTHGMKVWSLHPEKADAIEREIFLWDLAGQTDYQLVHQLFLDQTSVALILFDSSDPGETLAGVDYWVRALKRAAGDACPCLLVAGRADRGPIPLSAAELEEFRHEFGAASLHVTSAKNGDGIADLRAAIRAAVEWDALPVTHSPGLWQDLKSFMLSRRDDRDVLARSSDLKVAFRLMQPDRTVSDRAFDVVLAHLQAQGLIWKLAFGDLLLLRPELLNDYASAVILAARNDPNGLGSVIERDVLDAKIDLRSLTRLPDREAERALLHAVVERLIEREIALREGVHLVFPSKLNLPNPFAAGELPVDVQYRFDGAAEEIYARLVVQLVYSGAFELEKAWRNGALFRDVEGGRCGIAIEPHIRAKHLLGIFCGNDISLASRLLFSRFVHEHLHRRTMNRVERERVYRCDQCGVQVRSAEDIAARLAMGKTDIVCVRCESRIELLDELERKFGDLQILQEVRNLEHAGAQKRDGEVALTRAEAKDQRQEYDVFLAYNTVDENEVETIARALKRRGLNPWFGKWAVPPGRLFQEEIQRVLPIVPTMAVFIGSVGVGKWQNLEAQSAVRLYIQKRVVGVIPTFLPSGGPDTGMLLLDNFRFVRFQNLDDLAALDELEWGVRGTRADG